MLPTFQAKLANYSVSFMLVSSWGNEIPTFCVLQITKFVNIDTEFKLCLSVLMRFQNNVQILYIYLGKGIL